MGIVIGVALVALLAFGCGDDTTAAGGSGGTGGTGGTGGSGGGGAGGMGGDGGTGGTPKSACDTYCDNVIANCTGNNVVYSDAANCQSTCAAMPKGDPSDQGVNSVWCRAYHAGDPAAGNPGLHCPHTSVSSDDDVCGTACEAYCDQAMANCTGANELYPTRGDCETACAGFNVGAWDDTTGDTVECRAYHASFPAAGDPGFHCPHAGEVPTAQCVNP